MHAPPWNVGIANQYAPRIPGDRRKLPERAAYLLRLGHRDGPCAGLEHHGDIIATWLPNGFVVLHEPAKRSKSTRNLLRRYLGIPLHGKPWMVGTTPFQSGMVVALAPVRKAPADERPCHDCGGTDGWHDEKLPCLEVGA